MRRARAWIWAALATVVLAFGVAVTVGVATGPEDLGYSGRASATVASYHSGARACPSTMGYEVAGHRYTHDDSFCGGWHVGDTVRLDYLTSDPAKARIDFGHATAVQGKGIAIVVLVLLDLALLYAVVRFVRRGLSGSAPTA
ncbi:MAG: hypothetical protein FWE71_13225 [Nocardioidaceae bacterium]|nr:hypothetical protein [Nocardioidaceae bacterium]MCL2613892.1 hypothetical protein [Nocardioidaceae bacterium]